jgi:hypothetical protein
MGCSCRSLFHDRPPWLPFLPGLPRPRGALRADVRRHFERPTDAAACAERRDPDGVLRHGTSSGQVTYRQVFRRSSSDRRMPCYRTVTRLSTLRTRSRCRCRTATGECREGGVAFEATEAFTNPMGNVLGASLAAMLYDSVVNRSTAFSRRTSVPSRARGDRAGCGRRQTVRIRVAAPRRSARRPTRAQPRMRPRSQSAGPVRRADRGG